MCTLQKCTWGGACTYLPRYLKQKVCEILSKIILNVWLEIYAIYVFGCSIDAAQQQIALNFELVVSNQLFSVTQNKHPWCSAAAYVTAGYSGFCFVKGYRTNWNRTNKAPFCYLSVCGYDNRILTFWIQATFSEITSQT